MGQDIRRTAESNADMNGFLQRLRKETTLLAQWFQDGSFAPCSEGHTVGLELEMWLVDQNFQPLPENQKLLDALSDPLLVPELSKFNAEYNAQPELVGPGSLERLAVQMREYWQRIQISMGELQGHMLTIGSLPTLCDAMLSVEAMSEFERYKALNEYVLNLRRGKPLRLSIEGEDKLKSVHDDIMLEAAATSFQVHIQAPYELMTATFNAAVLVSAASVAISANSPFLLGAALWEESRIPLFEQAVSLPGFALLDGSRQQRVTFGHGYVQESLMELFLENAHSYPVLLPVTTNTPPDRLSHVALQNSTIWRWNRPVLGFDRDGHPSLRVEHRVMSAGPTIDDMIADLAFVLGVCHDLAPRLKEAHDFMPFTAARSNFYAAAKEGLNARVRWGEHGDLLLQTLILEELLPAARRGLKALRVSEEEINYYLDHVLKGRVVSRQTGAAWQKLWVKQHGRDLTGMTAAYFEKQAAGQAVHSWTV